jgi:hypothetical protein
MSNGNVLLQIVQNQSLNRTMKRPAALDEKTIGRAELFYWSIQNISFYLLVIKLIKH